MRNERDDQLTPDQCAYWQRQREESRRELERRIAEGLPTGDDPPELTPEDEEIFAEIIEAEIARKRKARSSRQ